MADTDNYHNESTHSHSFYITVHEQEYTIIPHGEINALFRVYEQQRYVTSVTLNNEGVWEAIQEDLGARTQKYYPETSFIAAVGKAIEAGI